MNTTKLFYSIAAIMATGAMASAECEDRLTCTLYSEANYTGDSYDFCLTRGLDEADKVVVGGDNKY